MASTTIFTAVMAVAVLFLTTTTTQAQNISCAQNLVQCLDYLNTTTTPPDNCCNSIREAVTNDLTCLCNLYNSPGLLESLNVNVTQVIDVSRRCSVNVDLNTCTKGGADAPSTFPPGVPGNGAGSSMTWNVFSSLLLLWAAMLSY